MALARRVATIAFFFAKVRLYVCTAQTFGVILHHNSGDLGFW